MTATTALEKAAVIAADYKPNRWLSPHPRPYRMSGRLKAVQTDSETGSIHTLIVEDVPLDDPQAIKGMTVDIGSTPGGKERGSVRLRSWGDFDHDNMSLPINLTAQNELGLQIGDYVTVREEYRVWQTDLRLQAILDGDGLIIGVNEYIDYNVLFTGAALNGPKPNIVAGLNADGTYKLVQPAGWCNPATGLRRVHFSNIACRPMRPGDTISTTVWVAPTGTLLGGIHDDEIDIDFPPGFHYVELVAQIAGGTQANMMFAIWAHDETFMPISIFNVTTDETGSWREMQVQVDGAENAASLDLFDWGYGTEVVYWEEPDFGGAPIPEAYRQHARGWITESAPLLRKDGGLSVKFAGLGWWMDRFDGNTQTFRGVDTDSDFMFKIQYLNRDRVSWFALRFYCSSHLITNIFFEPGVDQTTQRATIEDGSIWQQLAGVNAHFSLSTLMSDSYGNVWVDQDYPHRSIASRASIPPMADLAGEDWTDQGVYLNTLLAPNYSQITAAGSIYLDGKPVLYASAAPGKTRTSGTNAEEMPGQYLPNGDPQASLNDLTGQHLAARNNPQPDSPMPLVHNLDNFEPAWQRPIRATWAERTVHGYQLHSDLFMVRRVSIQHNFDSAPYKVITLGLERVTSGLPGQMVEVIQEEGVVQPPPDGGGGEYINLLPFDLQTLAAFHSDGWLSRTTTFGLTNPVWDNLNLNSVFVGSGGAGTISHFIVDAYSPFYLGEGDEVNGWIYLRPNAVTGRCRIYRITDIFAPLPTLTLQYTHGLQYAVWKGAQFERGVQNWGVGMLQQRESNVNFFEFDRCVSVITTNGASWTSRDVLAIPHGLGNDVGKQVVPGHVHVSPHTPGLVICGMGFSGFMQTGFYRSFDYGESFEFWFTPSPSMNELNSTIHVPYEDASDTLIYAIAAPNVRNVVRAMNTVVQDISIAALLGSSATNIWQFGLKSCDIDQAQLLAFPNHNPYLSGNSGGSWSPVTAPYELQQGNIAGDNKEYLFGWGANGRIAFRPGSGGFVDKRGSASPIHVSGNVALSPSGNIGGKIINICGGPNP